MFVDVIFNDLKIDIKSSKVKYHSSKIKHVFVKQTNCKYKLPFIIISIFSSPQKPMQLLTSNIKLKKKFKLTNISLFSHDKLQDKVEDRLRW